MDVIAALREQLRSANWLLEACMEGVTQDQLQWNPAGTAHSVASSYAHAVVGQDFVIHGMVQNKPPLAATTWANKVGVSALPPQEGGADWSGWARTVRVDLAAIKQYAQAVYAASDAYLAGLKPDELDRMIDLTAAGLGQQTLNWVLFGAVIGHVANHTGEIAAIKGVQGLQGYPF